MTTTTRRYRGAKIPLTQQSDIDAVREYFSDNRVLLDLFNVGINIGLRVSDLCQLVYTRVDYTNKLYQLIDKKTRKSNTVYLNNTVLDIIKQRRRDYPSDTYIFTNHYYDNTTRAHKNALNLHYINKQFKACGDWLGLNIGTHTMRKTFGAALYRQGIDLVLISKILNHSSPATTYAYIGLTQTDIRSAYNDLQL